MSTIESDGDHELPETPVAETHEAEQAHDHKHDHGHDHAEDEAEEDQDADDTDAELEHEEAVA
jgi:hypothetical protein